jgi:hypothetical protein
MIKVLPQFDVDEPGIFEKFDPLRFEPLHASIEGHHDKVEARLISCAPVSGRIRSWMRSFEYPGRMADCIALTMRWQYLSDQSCIM